MKTVIIMQGNVGVGKSTLARAIQKKDWFNIYIK